MKVKLQSIMHGIYNIYIVVCVMYSVACMRHNMCTAVSSAHISSAHPTPSLCTFALPCMSDLSNIAVHITVQTSVHITLYYHIHIIIYTVLYSSLILVKMSITSFLPSPSGRRGIKIINIAIKVQFDLSKAAFLFHRVAAIKAYVVSW
jgi:hypothetical protein